MYKVMNADINWHILDNFSFYLNSISTILRTSIEKFLFKNNFRENQQMCIIILSKISICEFKNQKFSFWNTTKIYSKKLINILTNKYILFLKYLGNLDAM